MEIVKSAVGSIDDAETESDKKEINSLKKKA